MPAPHPSAREHRREIEMQLRHARAWVMEAQTGAELHGLPGLEEDLHDLALELTRCLGDLLVDHQRTRRHRPFAP